MKRDTLVEFFSVLALLAALTAVIALFGLDLRATGYFYDPAAGFDAGDLLPWSALYDYGEYVGILMGVLAGLLFLSGFFWEKARPFRRRALFMVVVLAVGPGLIVNSVFKDHWGRARPRHVVEFGGTNQFSQPWVLKDNPKGQSFPSGHASVAFYTFTPFFLLRKSRPRWAFSWLGFGLLYGGLMGTARIAQGGHFLSDVLWAGGFVYLTGLVLADLMGVDGDRVKGENSTSINNGAPT